MLEKGRYTSVRLPIFKRCDTIEYFDKEQKSKRSVNKVKRAPSVFNFETPTKVSEVTTRLVVYNANCFNRVRLDLHRSQATTTQCYADSADNVLIGIKS